MTAPVRGNGTDLARWDPAREFGRLTQQLSRLFEGQDFPFEVENGFTPLADLEETDDAYVLEVELPGVKKKDIDIELDGRRLVISGERTEQDRSGWLRRRTRAWGRFRYEVVLGADVDPDGVEATLNDGVLRIRVPKSAADQRRHVQVK